MRSENSSRVSCPAPTARFSRASAASRSASPMRTAGGLGVVAHGCMVAHPRPLPRSVLQAEGRVGAHLGDVHLRLLQVAA